MSRSSSSEALENPMLKGSRDAVVHRLQPITIHGQLSYDLHYTFADEETDQKRVARLGPEAISPGVQAGDRVRLDFLVGVVTAVHRST
jgi:hypothetical protein